MHWYPTLLELWVLPTPDGVEGTSLGPLLKDPQASWSLPAITTYQRNNHAVRSEHWRYIRYSDGSEELYDHRTDPHEWTNVAARPEHRAVIAEHAKWLPATNVPGATAMEQKFKQLTN